MFGNSGDTTFSYFRETLTNATNNQRPIELLRNAISLPNHTETDLESLVTAYEVVLERMSKISPPIRGRGGHIGF
jgi:hypothetical protein